MRRRAYASLLSIFAATVAFTGLSSVVAPSALAARPAFAGGVQLSSYESALLSDINHARQVHGLPGLTIAAGTTDVARRWTGHLADQGQLEHNPNLASEISRAGSSGWGTIEENIGYGPASSPQTLFDAYMRSPEHRANILGKEVRYVGIGAVQRGTFAWNVMDFVDEYSDASRPAAHHASVATSAADS